MKKHIESTKTHQAGLEKPKKAPGGIPLIVFVWGIGLGLLSYVLSRFIFTPHPLHWASGVIGLLLGALIGYIWYRKRGDVIPF